MTFLLGLCSSLCTRYQSVCTLKRETGLSLTHDTHTPVRRDDVRVRVCVLWCARESELVSLRAEEALCSSPHSAVRRIALCSGHGVGPATERLHASETPARPTRPRASSFQPGYTL